VPASEFQVLPQTARPPSLWLGGLAEAPSLRLDFEDLPLVQGDQEGFKEVETLGSRSGRIELVGWDPPRLFSYVPKWNAMPVPDPPRPR